MNGFYVLNSLIWSVVGAVLGYKYGQMKTDVAELKSRLSMTDPRAVDGERLADPPGSAPNPGRHRWSLHRPSVQQMLGVVIIFMTVISTVVVAGYSSRLNSVSKCLFNYTTAYNKVIADRDAYAARSRASLRDFIVALDDLWLGFLKNAPPPGQQATPAQREASIAVLNSYLAKSKESVAALDDSVKARQLYPLPANNCADLQVRPLAE